MPNPGIFHGLRLEFLLGEVKGYAAAVANGTKEEFTKDVLHRFFKRFPPGTPPDEEPTEDEVAAVDDSLPDEELVRPDKQDFAEDEPGFNRALETYEARQADLLLRSAVAVRDDVIVTSGPGTISFLDFTLRDFADVSPQQIVRWFAYRHSRQASKTGSSLKSSDLTDPMFVMACRLLGKSSKKPRKPIAFNLWAKDKANKPAVDKAVLSIPKSQSQKRHNVAAVVQLKKELFEKQQRKTRKNFEEMASAKHKQLLEEWEFNLARPASKDPAARQMCIDGVTSFMQPILDLVVEFTGMHATLLLGGPEPAAQQMNIIGMHSGCTKGPVKMNFAEAEAKKFHGHVIPAFSDYLRKCFSPRDIKNSVIPVDVAPLLSIMDSKEVTYCAATGDNYALSLSLSPSDPPSTSTSAPDQKEGAAKASAGTKTSGSSKRSDTRDDGQDHSTSKKKEKKDEGSSGAVKKDGKDRSSRKAKRAGRKEAAKKKDRRGDGTSKRRKTARQSTDSEENEASSEDDDHYLSDAVNSQPRRNSGSSLLEASDDSFGFPQSEASDSAHSSLSKSYSMAYPLEAGSIPTSPIQSFSSSSPSSPSPSPSKDEIASDRSSVNPPPPLDLREAIPGLESGKMMRIGPPRRRRVQAPTPSPASADHAVGQKPTFRKDADHDRVPPSVSAELRSKRRADDSLRMDVSSKKHKGVQEKENESSVRGHGGGKRKAAEELDKPVLKRRKPLNDFNELSAGGDNSAFASTEQTAMPPAAVASIPIPTLPPGCCVAIQRTREMVVTGHWGPQWRKLIVVWLEFEQKERSHEVEGSSLLKATHRPSAVGDWIQRARNPYYRPTINLEDFQEDFWDWWKALQPQWRVISEEATARSVEGDWAALDKAGKNGLASVVAALFFWGVNLGDDTESATSWSLAVDDVSWVFEQLCGQSS